MAARKGWSAKLARPIETKHGEVLRTLSDARRFVLEQPDYIQRRGSWQHVAELLIAAAELCGAVEIEAATKAIERALFLEARLKLR